MSPHDAITVLALLGIIGLGIVLVVAFREGDWRQPITVDRDHVYEEGA